MSLATAMTWGPAAWIGGMVEGEATEVDLRNGLAFEAPDQDQVELAGVHAVQQVRQPRLPARFRAFPDQGATAARADQNLIGAGLAQFVAVLARAIDVQAVGDMLEQEWANPPLSISDF